MRDFDLFDDDTENIKVWKLRFVSAVQLGFTLKHYLWDFSFRNSLSSCLSARPTIALMLNSIILTPMIKCHKVDHGVERGIVQKTDGGE